MSFKEALKKLKASATFQKFKEKNKKAFLFSAFFVLNQRFEIETQQLDYFLTNKKAATFYVNDSISYKVDKFFPTVKITALEEKIKIDIDELKKIIEKELEKCKGFELNKVIAILQKINNVQLWNVTCMLSIFKMLKLHVDCFSGKILKSEEANLLDFMQVQKKPA